MRNYIFVFFYFEVAWNCLNSLKQEVKHSYYNLLDLSKLLMLWSDCFLSQSKYFDQFSQKN